VAEPRATAAGMSAHERQLWGVSVLASYVTLGVGVWGVTALAGFPWAAALAGPAAVIVAWRLRRRHLLLWPASKIYWLLRGKGD
jgi:Flp pilus assembly protein TadB